MKHILLYIFILMNSLYASELPNTDLQQNQYGYYGEGVVFGGYPIVGDWRLCPNDLSIADRNGSILYKAVNHIYGLSEDGKQLVIGGGYGTDMYTITGDGTNGCYGVEYYYQPGDFGGWGHSCIVCKANVNSKTYGQNSNSISITVGAD